MVKNIRVINKIIIILIVLIMSSTVLSNIVYAKPIVNTNDYGQGNLGNNTKALGIVGTILSVIQIVGVIVAVISISILGIKYMTGSVEEKADYKKSMIPFLVGTVLIVAVGTIIRIVNDLTSQAIGE